MYTNKLSYQHKRDFILCKLLKMILPQVHLRKPCYDFSFLQKIQFANFKNTTIFQEDTPIHSPTYPIGRSDGRCLRRAVTYSVYIDDIHLQVILSLHGKVGRLQSNVTKTKHLDVHGLIFISSVRILAGSTRLSRQ